MPINDHFEKANGKTKVIDQFGPTNGRTEPGNNQLGPVIDWFV